LQIEEGIATQRLRLFRLVAGLLITVMFVAAVPFSCAFRGWIAGNVASVLSRAECAARNLVVAQAGLMAARRGIRVSPDQFFAALGASCDVSFDPDEQVPSLKALRLRLKRLCRVLNDLPRCGARLLRRLIGPCSDRSGGLRQPVPVCPSFNEVRVVPDRIERPPDKMRRLFESGSLPPPSRCRAGGVGGWGLSVIALP